MTNAAPQQHWPADVYVLYDARARSGDTDDALVLVTADTLAEARTWRKNNWPDAVIYVDHVDADGVCRREDFIE